MPFEALWMVFPWALVVIGTTAVVVAYRRGDLSAALGITFVMATITRFGIPIAGSTIRFEQPAVLVLFALILMRDAGSMAVVVRRSIPFVGFAAVYLGAHLLSSALVAPERLESLKIAAWLGVSMLGGAVAAILAYRSGDAIRLAPWIVGAALLHIAVAAAAVASQVLLKTDWGVQHSDVLIGKAYGLALEANLYAILIAMAIPFTVLMPEHGGLSVSRGVRAAIIGALAIGLGLGYSRGGLVALAAATIALLFVAAVRRPRWKIEWLRVAGTTAATLFVAVAVIQGQDALARAGARSTDNLILVDVPAPSPREPDATPRTSDSPEPSTPPEVVGVGDTVAVRLRTIRLALGAFPAQPIIGHGTDAFKDHYQEITCDCPAHVSNLPVATLYEAGIVGAVGLGGFLLLVVVGALRLRAAALLAAILAMLVGYLFTDALRFGLNWIILGLVPGLLAVGSARASPTPDMTFTPDR
jgi:hypothetical protein